MAALLKFVADGFGHIELPTATLSEGRCGVAELGPLLALFPGQLLAMYKKHESKFRASITNMGRSKSQLMFFRSPFKFHL